MDSTPPRHRTLKPLSSSSSSSSSSASKLPIKRKVSHLDLDLDLDLHSHFVLSPRAASAPFHPDALPITTLNPHSKIRSPFKFHRIWTEPDEILFLQALFDSSSAGLSFPRDMPIFYNNFSASLSQPYTKSQFSEKLRRLRRKFRVISSRISRGLCYSRLSPHDRALFDISKKLWGSEILSVLPLGSDKKIDSYTSSNISLDYSQRINLVGVKVTFSPVLPVNLSDRGETNSRPIDINKSIDENVGKTRVDCGLDGATKGDFDGVKSVVAKSVMDVFDESMKEVERIHERARLRALSESEFERRLKVQRIAEVDVFARRLRLVLENSVNKLSF